MPTNHYVPRPVKAGQRLVLIDPDETQAPAAFNLLGISKDPHEIADQLVGVMSKVWAKYWGPRTDDLARHAVLTVAHLPDATLADLPRLLTDRRLRTLALRRVQSSDRVDSAGLEAFWDWWDSQTPGQQSQHTGPLVSNFRAVLSRPFTAQLFGTPRSTFRLDEILDGGILLVRLPKSLGTDTAQLTGSLLLAALLHAAAARVDQPEHRRLDASVIVDECHHFVNLPIGLDDALAETRGWRVSILLSHQHLGQLTPSMFEAIDANARPKVFFALAPSDVRKLAHHVAPWFPPMELARRDAFGVVVRMVIDGQDSEPFTLHTRPAPPVWPGRAEALRAAARQRGLSMADRQHLAQVKRLGRSAPQPNSGKENITMTPLSIDPVLPPGGWPLTRTFPRTLPRLATSDPDRPVSAAQGTQHPQNEEQT